MCNKVKEIRDFDSLFELADYFHSEEVCQDYLADLRWDKEIECPYCESNRVNELKGKTKRYKCYGCRMQFGVKVGTIFHDSKIPLRKWFIALFLITAHKKGISSHQLARDLKVTQKTAWFMLQRIRFGLNQDDESQFENEVEIDETYVGGKNKNRHSNKKVENSQGRSHKDKTPILGMVQRGGKVIAKKVDNVKIETLTPEVIKQVKNTAKIYTDEWLGYNALNKMYDHEVVKHNQGEYVKGFAHTNTIEGFWSLLKRSVFGIYHSVSKKHIQSYVDEMVFRYNSRDVTDGTRFDLSLAMVKNKRLSYKTLVNEEKRA